MIGTLRLALHEGLVGLVAEEVRPVAVEQVKNHPRFKYFREAGEDDLQSFLGVPLIDRGDLQGVLIVQTREPRLFLESEIRMLAEAAAQVAPVVSEARTLDRYRAGPRKAVALARNLWWSWNPLTPTGLFLDLDHSAGGSSITIPSHCFPKIPLARIERRAGELVLHGRINYAYRRQREYLEKDRTWGARHAGILRPRPGGLFFGGVRTCTSPFPLFRRARSSRRETT